MCKPIREYLELIRQYTREISMYGGIALAVLVYMDFRSFLTEQTRNQAAQTEVLRMMDERLHNLERYHK